MGRWYVMGEGGSGEGGSHASGVASGPAPRRFDLLFRCYPERIFGLFFVLGFCGKRLIYLAPRAGFRTSDHSINSRMLYR